MTQLAVDASELSYQDFVIFDNTMPHLTFTRLSRDEGQEYHPLSGEVINRAYESTNVTIPCDIQLRNLDKILDKHNLKTEGPSPDIILNLSNEWLSQNELDVVPQDRFSYAGKDYTIYQADLVDYLPTDEQSPLHLFVQARMSQDKDKL